MTTRAVTRFAVNHLKCKLSEAPPATTDAAAAGRFDGVVVIVHSTGAAASHECSRVAAPIPNVEQALSCATVVFDLTGCGDSGGEPKLNAFERDVDDVRRVVTHVRDVLDRPVVGLLGHGTGGLACLLYAQRFRDVKHVIAVSADAELTRRSNHALTWAQLQSLKSDGRLTVERPRPLKVAQAELDARPALEGLDGSAQFLVLCGSLDDLVPVEEARALVELIGSASAELRIIPGTGHDWSGQEATLAYAAGDFIWRSLRREASKENSPTRERLDDRPSGFNVFVDNLHAQVEEIHAAARANLPSMPADDDDDDDDDATPIESPPVRRLSREAVK